MPACSSGNSHIVITYVICLEHAHSKGFCTPQLYCHDLGGGCGGWPVLGVSVTLVQQLQCSCAVLSNGFLGVGIMAHSTVISQPAVCSRLEGVTKQNIRHLLQRGRQTGYWNEARAPASLFDTPNLTGNRPRPSFGHACKRRPWWSVITPVEGSIWKAVGGTLATRP